MTRARRRVLAISGALAAAAALFLPPGRANDPLSGDWRAYGRDPGGARFSPLDQIDVRNVTRLRRAWTFHTGDVHDDPRPSVRPAAFETTPLAVEGRLYLSTP